jgi:hypothetical protein
MGNLGGVCKLTATVFATAMAVALGTVPASASAGHASFVLSHGGRSAAPQQSATLTVTATQNIFGAGQASVPSGTGGEGVLPTQFTIPEGATALSFSAAGHLRFCGTTCKTGPAGRHCLAGMGSRVSDPNHFLSTFEDWDQGPLVAVFTEGTPAGPAPPSFYDHHQVPMIAPGLDQVFYVGKGGQTVEVPSGATALYLGFADALGFSGPAGYYGDNSGQVSVTVSVTSPGV